MKIAMIHTPLTTLNGAEKAILRIAIELEKLGHHVEIFTNELDRAICFPALNDKVKINVVPYATPLRRSYYHILDGMLRIGMNIPRTFDIINNHNFPSEWAAAIARKRLNIPAVWVCYEPPFWFFQPEYRRGKYIVHWPLFQVLDRISVKYIDDIIVLSKVGRDLVKKVYGRESKIVRLGIDVEQFEHGDGNSFRKKFDLLGNFLVLHIGTFVHSKHPEVAIMALSHLPDNVRLVFVGIGSDKAYRDLAHNLGISDRVKFLSNLTESELADLYKACDTLICPAEQTWGLVVIEAMVAGKPVIVSEKAGVAEIIQDNVNGITISSADPLQIAEKIKCLINNPNSAKNIGANGLEYVTSNLSWESTARNMESIFQKVLESN